MSGAIARALATEGPIDRTQAFVPATVTRHENIRRGSLNRTNELLRGVRRVDRGGKRYHGNTRDTVQSQVLVRPLGVSSVLFRGGGCDGRIDSHRSGVSEVIRHGHGGIVGRGQGTKQRGGGSNFRQRRNQLPLGVGGDLGNGAFADAVREGAGRVGLEAFPRGRYLLERPSLELSFPWPRILQHPAPFRRDMLRLCSAPCPRRALPSWPAEDPLMLGRWWLRPSARQRERLRTQSYRGLPGVGAPGVGGPGCARGG